MSENVLEVGKVAKEQVKNEKTRVKALKLKTTLERRKATRLKWTGKIILAMLLAELSFLAFQRVASWFDNNKIIFDAPISFDIKFNKILRVEKREPIKLVEYVGQKELDELVAKSEDPTVAEYIIKKFGPVEGIKALAIAKAESGLRCNAVNTNTNATADLGVFQLNTVHLKKGGNWTLANMGDCYKNIDLAYQLYQEQGGFGAWVAYTTGSYLANLSK